MILRVENVSFDYEDRRGVAGVSFEVGAHGLIAIGGRNGSGKSTLLKLIARVLRPRAGRVVFEERAEWKPKEYAQRVGYLPQETEAAFPVRAIDAVVSGRAPYLGRFAYESADDFRHAERALGLCDAAHLRDRYLDQMSGGERKRVLLARVLAGEPRLILLDEPLASLDIAHVQQFSILLRDISRRTGAAILFASHDLNWAAAYSDRMLLMRDGSLAVDGTPDEVMRPEPMRRIFGIDARRVEVDGRGWIVPG